MHNSLVVFVLSPQNKQIFLAL